ncbi:MAG: oxidative damage protection protein [Gammaproteobacteria bacterium]|nr:oxidative damage protection protein [Gammaproteobacteria bacterium]
MTDKLIYCQKLKKDAPALKFAPLPGEAGTRIILNISAEAWQDWIKRQTMFINEYRLNLLDDEAKVFLKEQREKFLFGNEDVKPSGYTPQEKLD